MEMFKTIAFTLLCISCHAQIVVPIDNFKVLQDDVYHAISPYRLIRINRQNHNFNNHKVRKPLKIKAFYNYLSQLA